MAVGLIRTEINYVLRCRKTMVDTKTCHLEDEFFTRVTNSLNSLEYVDCYEDHLFHHSLFDGSVLLGPDTFKSYKKNHFMVKSPQKLRRCDFSNLIRMQVTSSLQLQGYQLSIKTGLCKA